MGIFDKAKEALSAHSEHVDAGIEKAGDLIDERTGGQYAGQVDKGQDFASNRLQEHVAGRPDPQVEQQP